MFALALPPHFNSTSAIINYGEGFHNTYLTLQSFPRSHHIKYELATRQVLSPTKPTSLSVVYYVTRVSPSLSPYLVFCFRVAFARTDNGICIYWDLFIVPCSQLNLVNYRSLCRAPYSFDDETPLFYTLISFDGI